MSVLSILSFSLCLGPSEPLLCPLATSSGSWSDTFLSIQSRCLQAADGFILTSIDAYYAEYTESASVIPLCQTAGFRWLADVFSNFATRWPTTRLALVTEDDPQAWSIRCIGSLLPGDPRRGQLIATAATSACHQDAVQPYVASGSTVYIMFTTTRQSRDKPHGLSLLLL